VTVRDEGASPQSGEGRYFSAIHSDRRVQLLQEFLRGKASIYVLAGALRDAIASHYVGRAATPRDFDLAVAGVCRENFDDVLSPVGERNRHGGYLLRGFQTPDWDVWRLEETIGIKKTGAPCSLENVLRTFNLDCNAIALDLRTGLFLDGGAIKAIRQNTVHFVRDAIPHSEGTFAAKALFLNLRLKYEPTADMKRFVSTHLNYASLEHEARKLFPTSGQMFIPTTSPSIRERLAGPLSSRLATKG